MTRVHQQIAFNLDTEEAFIYIKETKKDKGKERQLCSVKMNVFCVTKEVA